MPHAGGHGSAFSNKCQAKALNREVHGTCLICYEMLKHFKNHGRRQGERQENHETLHSWRFNLAKCRPSQRR